MTYTPTKWEDLPSTDTPLNAKNMNKIEHGIKSAHDALDDKLDKSAIVQSTGQSTTQIMSQKAVTDALQNAGGGVAGDGYTKEEADAKFQPKGDYATNATLASKLDKTAVVQELGSSITSVMSQDASTKTFQPKGDYAVKGESYTKAESDTNFQPKGSYQSTGYSYSKTESDEKYQPKGDYALKGESYTKEESDDNFQPKGDYQEAGYSYSKVESDTKYQPIGDYEAAGTSYTKEESDAKYQPVDDYSLKGESYTKEESDDNFQPKGDYATNAELNGKFDKAGGIITGDVTFSKNAIKSTKGTHTLPDESGTLMQVGDFGWGGYCQSKEIETDEEFLAFVNKRKSQIFATSVKNKYQFMHSPTLLMATNNEWSSISVGYYSGNLMVAAGRIGEQGTINTLYGTANTTKDSNGNLKVASPIVKVFADHIETNGESEGATMEHLGVGHYLIKGVVGFNADGAWGINNGVVIPQDHNGKNLVLIDYDVKKDGSIELFVFHQQNAEVPERFQNKRIKDFDEDGNPIYFENYEPCDVPESRWVDMRVEMPEDSIYNLKQAEAESLAEEGESLKPATAKVAKK